MKPRSINDDRGESLIELLVAMGIMTTAVVALVGAIATSVRMSDLHRRQTVAGVHVKAFAETLRGKVAETPSKYTECQAVPGPASTYQGYFSVPAAESTIYAAEIVRVRYWDGSAFTTTCPASGDLGVQLVSLKVRGLDASRATVEETLDVTLRKPCRAPAEGQLCS